MRREGWQDKDVGINILAQDSLLGVVLVMVDIEYRDSYADNQSWSRPSVHYTLPLLWSAAVCVGPMRKYYSFCLEGIYSGSMKLGCWLHHITVQHSVLLSAGATGHCLYGLRI